MARRPSLCIALALCALALVPLGCGGSSSKSSSTTATSNAAALWRNRTQQICKDGQAAIAKLGYVEITYAGIARVGLPAVKQKLDVWIGRLLAILGAVAQQQRLLHPPTELSSAATAERQVETQEQHITQQLRSDIAASRTAREFSAAFRSWVQSDQEVVARGNSLASQYGLLACVAPAAS